jgi:hypothetical protein
MITLNGVPKNTDEYIRLAIFIKEILDICKDLDITPILDGSLAVFAYTKNRDMDVKDIDLSVPAGWRNYGNPQCPNGHAIAQPHSSNDCRSPNCGADTRVVSGADHFAERNCSNSAVSGIPSKESDRS